jgi:hypothetical protein
MIFISHSSDDDSIAKELCDFLEASNVKCWIDHRDIPHSSSWDESIVKAIKNSNLILLVFSKKANVSSHVKRELAIAVKYEIDIIPFQIEEFKVSEKLEYYLTDIQWFKAIGNSLENHLKRLLNTINNILEKLKIQPLSKPEIERKFFKGVYLPELEVAWTGNKQKQYNRRNRYT